MEDFKIDTTDRLAHIEESLKSAHKRIDNIDAIAKSVYEIAASIKTMQHDITDMSGKIKSIEEKPAKRWDLIITTAITTVVGIIVGYFINL